MFLNRSFILAVYVLFVYLLLLYYLFIITFINFVFPHTSSWAHYNEVCGEFVPNRLPWIQLKFHSFGEYWLQYCNQFCCRRSQWFCHFFRSFSHVANMFYCTYWKIKIKFKRLNWKHQLSRCKLKMESALPTPQESYT